ncbi:hypothetical protein BZG01_04360 [Labilibaculum manganireducens]|uniref:Uncharacterized protein n=1 Tax=Labilibaculum manganireducens TaxID=1940525 RepID=A0A2N3IDP2_9BACT|nr:hypothetical protein [Labilibaculum manganireducens]PKQ68452.1 hypothetical protein BZG01_04360 [Labilibaculum manganireducens]
MKKITKCVPTWHIMRGSLLRNQFSNFKSVQDGSLFISFFDKTNWLNSQSIKEVMVEKCHLQKNNFWSQFLFPINTI